VKGIFHIFHKDFSIINKSWLRGNSSFSSIKKIKRRDECCTSRCTKMPLYHIVGSVVVLFFCWCGTCLLCWSDLSPMCLSFLPSILSPPFEITIWPFWLLVFQLQFLFFFISNFYLGCFVEVLYVFDFILQSQFTKYYVFQFGLYFLDFYFFPWSFCKSFIGFQFHHSIQINDIMFFNLILIVLISNFFLVLFCKIYYSFQFYPLIMSHPRERSMAILDWFRGLLFYCE